MNCVLKKPHTFLYGFFLLAILIGIDQIIKYVIVHHSTALYLCNYGVAFGVILPLGIFLLLWGMIMVFVGWYWIQKRHASFLYQVPLMLIIAGGLSNMGDRIFYGCVVDYMPFLTISSFNIADVLISVGAIVWIFQIFCEKR